MSHSAQMSSGLRSTCVRLG
uniref:Uncharacterized protein n=1 Tax=Arundo donax TaxID=35708 RepID=A0A0A9C4M1_ARUDO